MIALRSALHERAVECRFEHKRLCAYEASCVLAAVADDGAMSLFTFVCDEYLLLLSILNVKCDHLIHVPTLHQRGSNESKAKAGT